VLKEFKHDSLEKAKPQRGTLKRQQESSSTSLDRPLLPSVSFVEVEHTGAQNIVHTMVKSARFEILCMTVVILNLCVSLVQNEMKLVASLEDWENLDYLNWFEMLQVGFLSFYTFEMVLKLWIYKCDYFRGKEGRWNTFDLFLVLVGVFSESEFFLSRGGSFAQFTWLRVLRPLRLVRSLRLVKFLRFFKDLRIIADSLASAGHSFAYASLMVFCIMFATALILIQGVGQWLSDNKAVDSDLKDQVIIHWGGIGPILLTLFQSISGGGAWGTPAGLLRESAGTFYFAVFVFFVSLVCFAVLRLLTGIFTNHAMAASRFETDESAIGELRRWFHVIDSDDSGTVSCKEIRAHLHAAEFKQYISELGISGGDVMKIFRLLSSHFGDDVEIEELVSSFSRLRGPARSVDIELLMYDVQALKKHHGLMAKTPL